MRKTAIRKHIDYIYVTLDGRGERGQLPINLVGVLPLPVRVFDCSSGQRWYARRMGQPTQRATNYTARSNIEPAQIFLHANGQSAPRSGGARDVGRGAGSHTPSTASESFSQSVCLLAISRVPFPSQVEYSRLR